MYYLSEHPFHRNLFQAVYDMVSTNEQAGPPEKGSIEGSAIDRLLRVFGDVRAGEGRDVVFMFLNVFLLLLAYYVLKTVREPLILTGGAQLKTYAAAAQAAVLLFYVPAYGWLVNRLPRQRLIVVVVLFFFAWLQLFFLAGQAGLPYVGFAFYVWVGIFSLTLIAQFWSMANDIYTKPEGDRLFPLIAIGSTAGAPLGAALAERLFANGVSPWTMMQLAGGILLVHLGLYFAVRKRGRRPAPSASAVALSSANGFALVLRSPYLRLIALLLVLLNIVNTSGEYILSSLVTDRAAALAGTTPGFDRDAFIGAYFGNYFFWTNVASVILQAFVVSRVVKYLGMAGVLFALPLTALGGYGFASVSAVLMVVRVMKTLENSTDYSLMNTAKQMLWLPTSREQKFKAKQAIDTFFVRAGDMLAAAVVFAGTSFVTLSPSGFARINLVVVVVSLGVTWALLREYRQMTQETRAKAA